MVSTTSNCFCSSNYNPASCEDDVYDTKGEIRDRDLAIEIAISTVTRLGWPEACRSPTAWVGYGASGEMRVQAESVNEA